MFCSAPWLFRLDGYWLDSCFAPERNLLWRTLRNGRKSFRKNVPVRAISEGAGEVIAPDRLTIEFAPDLEVPHTQRSCDPNGVLATNSKFEPLHSLFWVEYMAVARPEINAHLVFRTSQFHTVLVATPLGMACFWSGFSYLNVPIHDMFECPALRTLFIYWDFQMFPKYHSKNLDKLDSGCWHSDFLRHDLLLAPVGAVKVLCAATYG